MALEEEIDSMKANIQVSLDQLISSRSSSLEKFKALRRLEKILATAFFDSRNDFEARDSFLALQYTFECNVPAHVLSWLNLTTAKLETMLDKVPLEAGEESEADDLISQLTLALSIMQGVILNHAPSKSYMGRKPGLQILLDLLLTSRRQPLSPEKAASKSKSNPSQYLTSIVLDTLLCILVDSSAGLRAFEEANGVQAVVKILKRAGTPREVRMKCLEFLYFYLLDENPNPVSALKLTPVSPPSTAPATPVRPQKPYLSGTPLPMSRYGSSSFPFSSSSTSSFSSGSSSSSRSTSSSSAYSFSSTSSNPSSSTATSSSPGSPIKGTFGTPALIQQSFKAIRVPEKRVTTPLSRPQTPPNSPASTPAKLPPVRPMMFLKKDIDYEPQSPKKVARVATRPTHRKSLSTSTPVHPRPRTQLTLSGSKDEFKTMVDSTSFSIPFLPKRMESNRWTEDQDFMNRKDKPKGRWKTTEEKKELLGSMLGNVDALVEGVRKAGIWGLA